MQRGMGMFYADTPQREGILLFICFPMRPLPGGLRLIESAFMAPFSDALRPALTKLN